MSSGRRVIAAIGIDHYQARPRLTNAVSDAQGAVTVFGKLGFEPVVAPLLDGAATRDAVQALVNDDLRTLGTDDSLVLFFAGHGTTRTDALGTQTVKTGYLIPVDASDKAATWIELDSWLRTVAKLPPKHILVILDACHSGIALGSIIKWRDIATWQDTPLSTLDARRSRRIITSALDDQVALDSGPVPGHSLFTGCLIEGLTHDLGTADRRVTTGSELGIYLQRRVETYPSSKQTPDFGTFDFDDRGELVIALDGGPLDAIVGALPPPSPPATRGGAGLTPTIVLMSGAVPSRLERQLASALSSIHDNEQEIVNAASAAGLPAGEVARFPRPIDTWQVLIAAQRGTDVLRTILTNARERNKRIDWSAFDPLLERPRPAGLTSLALSIGWKGERETNERFRVVPASANTSLAVRVCVFGAAELEPVIEVATRTVGGRATTHTVSLTRVAGSNTWAGEVGIAASWRTRTIGVRARAGDQRARTTLTLTSGINLVASLACWAACLVFALFWLWPIELRVSWIAGLVSFGIVATASLVATLKLNERGSARFLRSLVECIERGALAAAVVALAVLLLPHYLLVDVYNDTAEAQDPPFAPDLELAAGEHRVVWRWSITDAPPSDFCVCPTDPRCPCSHSSRRWMSSLELHCAPPGAPLGVSAEMGARCSVQRVHVQLDKYLGGQAVHGTLEMSRSWPTGFHALRFAAATKLGALKVLRGGVEVGEAHDLDVPAGAGVPLLPDDGPITLQLADGSVECPPHSQLVSRIAPPIVVRMRVRSGEHVSTWWWGDPSGAKPAWLCEPTTPPAQQTIEFGALSAGLHVPLTGLARTIKLHDGELTCAADSKEIQTVTLPESLARVDLARGTLVRIRGTLGAVCAPFSGVNIGGATCTLGVDAIRCTTALVQCWAPINDLHSFSRQWPPPCSPCPKADEAWPADAKATCSSLCTCAR